MPGAVWGLVLAAGAGTRFGDAKQFATLGGVRLVDRVVATARAACGAIALVLPAGRAWDGEAVTAVVAGGATRAASVRAGLAAIDDSADIVVVHDAAHPLASVALFRAVIAAVREGAAGAVPGLALPEALKRLEGDRIVATVARDQMVQVQTPQAYRAEVLRSAHAADAEAAEDSELVEALGEPVVVVPGDPRNLHVTTPRDLVLAAGVLGA